jgi:hypothetical protein
MPIASANIVIRDKSSKRNHGVAKMVWVKAKAGESINCYFCDYDKNINQHHIIPKYRGGLNTDDNLLNLCPNCHTMIHSRIGYLTFSNGYLYMINLETDKLIYAPSKRQIGNLKTAPYLSIMNGHISKKLVIKLG